MKREFLTVTVSPKTKQKLEKIKEVTGVPYGILIDFMVRDYQLIMEEELPALFPQKEE